MADKSAIDSSLNDVVVARVVVSPKDAPVTETALVLSDAILEQLVLTAPLPPFKRRR